VNLLKLALMLVVWWKNAMAVQIDEAIAKKSLL
jgi:hypothetical protein